MTGVLELDFARWFVALRCYAEECAFSLSTQAQDHVCDLTEYRRVEPAQCQTGATSGGAGCERFVGIERVFSAMKIVFASRSMVHLNGRSRVFVPF
jgi:hypothetical protein